MTLICINRFKTCCAKPLRRADPGRRLLCAHMILADLELDGRQRKVIMAPTHLGSVNDATDEDCDVTEKLRARRNAPLHRTR